MFQRAIKHARERNCHMMQLTTDKERPNALRFYEILGFNATQEGLKLHLDAAQQGVEPDALTGAG